MKSIQDVCSDCPSTPTHSSYRAWSRDEAKHWTPASKSLPEIQHRVCHKASCAPSLSVHTGDKGVPVLGPPIPLTSEFRRTWALKPNCRRTIKLLDGWHWKCSHSLLAMPVFSSSIVRRIQLPRFSDLRMEHCLNTYNIPSIVVGSERNPVKHNAWHPPPKSINSSWANVNIIGAINNNFTISDSSELCKGPMWRGSFQVPLAKDWKSHLVCWGQETEGDQLTFSTTLSSGIHLSRIPDFMLGINSRIPSYLESWSLPTLSLISHE